MTDVVAILLAGRPCQVTHAVKAVGSHSASMLTAQKCTHLHMITYAQYIDSNDTVTNSRHVSKKWITLRHENLQGSTATLSRRGVWARWAMKSEVARAHSCSHVGTACCIEIKNARKVFVMGVTEGLSQGATASSWKGCTQILTPSEVDRSPTLSTCVVTSVHQGTACETCHYSKAGNSVNLNCGGRCAHGSADACLPTSPSNAN